MSLPERIDHRDRLILQCAISEIKVEFVDGVHGDTVAEKALPADPGQLAKTEIGSWRAHLNAIKRSVVPFPIFKNPADGFTFGQSGG